MRGSMKSFIVMFTSLSDPLVWKHMIRDGGIQLYLQCPILCISSVELSSRVSVSLDVDMCKGRDEMFI